jgi:hypothetical protein
MPSYTHAAHNSAIDVLVKWDDGGQFVIIGDESQITDRTLVNLFKGTFPPGWAKAPATPAEIIASVDSPTRQHTPGPWTVTPTSNPDREFGISDSESTIVCRLDHWRGKAEVTQDANAKLIAAAPELLAACQSVLSSLEHHLADDFLPETRQVLRDAIIAATELETV